MQPLEISLFLDPFMLSVDASGVVPVEVSPLRPCGARPPLRGAVVTTVLFAMRMANKTAIMAAHGEQKGRYDSVQGLSNPHEVSIVKKSECHKMLVKTDKLFRFG